MKILVLTGLDPRSSFNSGGVRTYNINLIKIAEYLDYKLDFYENNTITKLLKLNKKVYNNYDVILINVSVYDKGFIKLIYELWKINNKKIIVQCHGGSFHTLKFYQIYKLLFSSILSKKANRFLVLNTRQKNSLKRIFKIDDNKIIMIPNFTNNDFDLKVKKYDDKLKFFYIGRIVAEKGIFDFAEALLEINNNNIEFNVVGTGPDEKKLLEYVKRDKRIIYHGKKFGNEKERLFANNHIFVFLTKLPEGFPISILEAMNYGMAILSTEFSNSETLVIDNYNGFIVKPIKEEIKDKIEQIVKNRDMIIRMGRNSKYILGKKYSLEKQGIETFKKVFETN